MLLKDMVGISGKNAEKTNKMGVIILGVTMVFYLFFAFYDGVVIGADSPSYIYMHISREPFYPLLLHLFRSVPVFSGENEYLFAVVLCQSILAAVATWSIVDYLRKKFQLSFLWNMIILMIFLSVSLINRFIALRSSMYSNSILSEGIACSLFLLFFRYLIEYCFTQSKKSLTIAAILSFILISTRKQMWLTLFLIVICLFYLAWQQKNLKTGILRILICVGFLLLSTRLFDFAYNYAIRGQMISHSSDARFLATMIFYTSEREDYAAIPDEDVRGLLENIHDICEEQGYLMHSAGKGWYNRVEHFGNSYDKIQIDTMWPMVWQYVEKMEMVADGLEEKEVDTIFNQLILKLFPKVWGRILQCFTDNFLSGLVTTVAKRSPLLIFYTFFAYGFYLFLLVHKRKKFISSNAAIVGQLVLLSVVTNVAIVSMVIFCQTRYTIYNMPLFYTAGVLLFKERFRINK